MGVAYEAGDGIYRHETVDGEEATEGADGGLAVRLQGEAEDEEHN